MLQQAEDSPLSLWERAGVRAAALKPHTQPYPRTAAETTRPRKLTQHPGAPSPTLIARSCNRATAATRLSPRPPTFAP